MREANTPSMDSPHETATERIAEFVASATYEVLPAGATELARNALIDWLGVAVAGSRETGSRILADYLRSAEARKEATVICQGFRTTAEFAALANGNTGHAIDFDDTFPDTVHFNMHPSACIFPAVLALAEKHGKSGRQMLTSYVVGMEVLRGLGEAIGPANSRSGWHPTPVLGSIGSAAACANLLGINKLQCQYSIGIAASLAGGIVLNFGSMTKPMHAGNAARNGVIAAELAAVGFTSHPNVLDGKNSFCQMFGDGKPIDGLMGDDLSMGEQWRFVSTGIGFKYYPSCRSTHSSIDATRHLRNSHGIKPDQIAEIVCKINPHHLNMAKFIQPETGYQGKFSIPYCIATALCNGNVTLADFTDAGVNDPLTRSIISKVRFVDAPSGPDGLVSLGAEITISLNDGRSFSHFVAAPTGEPENPITDEQLADKFKHCSGLVMSEAAGNRVLELARRVDMMADLALLTDMLANPPRS